MVIEPNYNNPLSWHKLSPNNGFFRKEYNIHIQSSPSSVPLSSLFICPRCSSVVYDASEHYRWHQELTYDLK